MVGFLFCAKNFAKGLDRQFSHRKPRFRLRQVETLNALLMAHQWWVCVLHVVYSHNEFDDRFHIANSLFDYFTDFAKTFEIVKT